MLRLIVSDLRAKAAWCYDDDSPLALLRVLLTDGTGAMLLYRAMQWSRARGLLPLEWIFNKLNVVTQGCIIGRGAEFGPGFVLIHSNGVVINGQVQGGAAICIEHQVTIGADRRRSPRLGDHVFIGAGAKVIGPVTIGSHSRIGANAVVISDVPDHATAVGVPARIVRRRACAFPAPAVKEPRTVERSRDFSHGGAMPVSSFCRHHRHPLSRGLTGLLVALSLAVTSAQSGPSEPLMAHAVASSGVERVPPADYVIGADDVLAVVFWKEPDISGQVRVRPDGRISLPLLRDVQAAGLTPEQLREHLEAVAKPFFATVNATVIVHEINSRKVFVTGDVAHPGGFNLNGPMTVLQAVALAGGLTEFSDAEHIDVLRTEQGVARRLAFSYKDVLKGRKADVPLKPGDTIVVR